MVNFFCTAYGSKKCLRAVKTIQYQCRSVCKTFQHWCRTVRTLRHQADGAKMSWVRSVLTLTKIIHIKILRHLRTDTLIIN